MRGFKRATDVGFESLEFRRLLSFSLAGDHAVGNLPNDVVVADFNADGADDLATVNHGGGGNNVSVLLGNGSGGFAPAQHFPFGIGLQPSDLATGDLNGDGKIDLVTANAPNSLSLLFGNGAGGFGAAQTVWTPTPPANAYSAHVSHVEVADVNADGKSDLVYVFEHVFRDDSCDPDGPHPCSDPYSFASYVAVSLGNGNGTFATPVTWFIDGAPSNGLAVGDLDSDGKLDVAASSYSALVILLGQGNGSFSLAQTLPYEHGMSADALAIGDFNADGTADLAKADDFHAGVLVLLGNGNGTFSENMIAYAAGQTPASISVVDFNLDRKVDLLTGNVFHTVSLLVGNGDGTFAAPTQYPVAPGTPAYVNYGATAGDVNNDGRPDVAAISQPSSSNGPGNVRVLLNGWNFAGKTWISPASGGNWSTAANWSPGGVPAASDHVSIAGKSVSLGSGATVASLTLTGGATLSVGANGGRILRTSNLSIGDASKLNLNDNDLIIDYTGGDVGASPIGAWNGASYTGVTGMIARGYTFGDWTGDGLVTTTAQARTGVTTLAVAEAARLFDLTGTQTAMFSGQTVDATAVLVKYTYTGDVNLEGTLDGADYGVIDNWVQFPGTNRYENGDFNFDGVIDGADYGLIDHAIQLQGPSL
jgi:hypothetical protein